MALKIRSNKRGKYSSTALVEASVQELRKESQWKIQEASQAIYPNVDRTNEQWTYPPKQDTILQHWPTPAHYQHITISQLKHSS